MGKKKSISVVEITKEPFIFGRRFRHKAGNREIPWQIQDNASGYDDSLVLGSTEAIKETVESTMGLPLYQGGL